MNMKHVIITRSGKQIEFGNVRVEDIDIKDIAHSLSNLCRFTGHCSSFYSVAQHSILCSKMLHGSPTERMRALLHDAPEAYLNDLSSPLKSFIRGRYMEEHDRIEKTIAAKFSLGALMTDGVKVIDWKAFLVEWNQLFFGRTYEENLSVGIDMDDCPSLSSDCLNIFSLSDPEIVCSLFLDRYFYLKREIELDSHPVADRSSTG